MKAVFALVVFGLAVAASAEIPSESPVYDFHRKLGIPLASSIRAYEQQDASQRIVGGSVSDISQTPYQVGLVITILWIFTSVCGGSLLSANRVITAAHCNFDGAITAQGFTVVLGTNTIFSGGQRIATNDVTMYPNWNPNTAANDVAILRLPISAVFSNVVQPITLPSGNELNDNFVGRTALASGWGLTSDGGAIGANQLLSSVNLPVITNAQCAAIYGPWVHTTNICTSGAGGMGTCNGDSGGPLVIDNNGRRILVGITSYGAYDGCQIGLPAAFARVTSFTSWLLSQ